MVQILLVEDQAIIALRQKQVLERNGFAVTVAATGEQAVDRALSQLDISLVLMDIDLGPGIDGTVAAQRILAEREVPVVFLSSHTEADVVEKTEGITSYGYIVKNSGDTVLLASIKMAFRLHAADRTIQHERDNLEAIMEASRVGMFVVDRNLSVVRANPAAERISGQLFTELKDHSSCGDPEQCSVCELDGQIQTTLSSRTIVEQREAEFELEDASDSGETRRVWLRYSVAPLTLLGEAAALVTMEDCTAERRDRERMRLLSVISESENNILVITDADRKTTWVNGAFVSLSGYSLEEMLGRNPGEVLQSADPDLDLNSRMTHALDAGRAFQEEIVNYSKSGRAYWIHLDVRPVRDARGVLTNFVAIQRDVTERHLFEERINSRDARVQAVVEGSSDGIVAMDRAGVVTYANAAYASFTGHTIDEIVNLTPDAIYERIHPDHAADLYKRLYDAIERGAREMVYRYKFRRGDGRYIWREDLAYCFYDDDKTLEQSWIVARSVEGVEGIEFSFEAVDRAEP